MNLHHVEAGTGQPLVLIHGFPLDHTLWLPQLEGLADIARVIVPDLRGFGKSPGPDGPVTMEHHARDVKDLLDHLGIERALIGGLSMGGYVALAFADLFPDMLEGLILCNTRSVADGDAAKRMREITALKALKGDLHEVISPMVGTLLSEKSQTKHPDLAQFVLDMMARQSPEGVAASSRGMALRPDRTPLLGQIQVPALVITGSDDTLISPNESHDMASQLPDRELVVIPGVGHLSCQEDPQGFNTAVRKFLGRLRLR